jgi:hypothetical protein
VIPTCAITLGDFWWSLVDGTLPGLLVLALGVVSSSAPASEGRLFLAFCLVTATINLTYNDLVMHPSRACSSRCGRSRRPSCCTWH